MRKIFCEHFYWPLFWINDTCIRKLLSQLELNSLSNWIFMSLSSNLRVERRKQNTGYNLFQALRTTAKNFQPNLHFWQIVPSPTNFPFSTGLTKSTRLLGKHERVHEMASRPNLTKKAQLSLQFLLSPSPGRSDHTSASGVGGI